MPVGQTERTQSTTKNGQKWKMMWHLIKWTVGSKQVMLDTLCTVISQQLNGNRIVFHIWNIFSELRSNVFQLKELSQFVCHALVHYVHTISLIQIFVYAPNEIIHVSKTIISCLNLHERVYSFEIKVRMTDWMESKKSRSSSF